MTLDSNLRSSKRSITLISEMRSLKLNTIKSLVPGHRAAKWQRGELLPSRQSALREPAQSPLLHEVFPESPQLDVSSSSCGSQGAWFQLASLQVYQGLLLFLWPQRKKLQCGALVPWPGTKPTPPALAAWSFNYWITKAISMSVF